MNECTGCKVELSEGVNWSAKGGHKFCRTCFKDKYNKRRMYLGGKYISFGSQVHKSGAFKTLDDAWSHKELDNKNISGEIYIITNDAFRGWVKVGMSINATDRIKSYQTCSPHRDYLLYSSFATEDRHTSEREVHKILDSEFDRQNEWFKADAQAVDWILSQYFGVRYEESTN